MRKNKTIKNRMKKTRIRKKMTMKNAIANMRKNLKKKRKVKM